MLKPLPSFYHVKLPIKVKSMETFVFKRQITGFRQNIPEHSFIRVSLTSKIVGVGIKRKISEYKKTSHLTTCTVNVHALKVFAQGLSPFWVQTV